MSGRPRPVDKLLTAASFPTVGADASKAFPKVKPVIVPRTARSSFAATKGSPKPPTVTFDTMAPRRTNAG